MQRNELLNELNQLVEMEFNVVEEAFAMANEIDLSSFSVMTPRAAAVVLTQRGLKKKLGEQKFISLMRGLSQRAVSELH
jgi:hypothetical protein